MRLSKRAVAELAADWSERWADARPIADELRSVFPDRWVRFHSLPESKRYADTESEYATLLSRHHTVLRELSGRNWGTTNAVAITVSDSFAATPTRRSPELASVAPGARHWVSCLGDDEPPWAAIWTHVYANGIRLSPGALDPLLRLVADDRTWGVVIAPENLEWLYHPYDGGADVICSSTEARDVLASAHSSWLSAHPGGL